MSDSPTETSRVQLKDLPHTRASDFRLVYTNNTGLALNFYDITLIFGYVVPDAFKPGETQIEDRVAVTMSWEHAKALVNGLRSVVEQYESENNAKLRELPK
jgi:hypothetical protein